jgi:hypothetical protein
MAAEPVTIFSHKRDPAAVVSVVRQLAPTAQVITGDAGDATWTQIVVPGKRGLIRRGTPLVMLNDPDYYSGAGWETQLRGFTAYLLGWPPHERHKEVMSLLTALSFAVAIPPEQHAMDFDDVAGDAHALLVLAVAKRLDAILFTPTTLRDASGRVIIAQSGRADAGAVVPNVPAVGTDPNTGHPTVRMPADLHFRLPGPNNPSPGEGDPQPEPPTAARVAARALALAAVAGRGLLEQEDASDPGVDKTRQGILKWVDDVGLRDELEPDEWKVLQLPIGAVPQQDAVNAAWRIEGLAVLAWALSRHPMPAHDQPVDPGKLLPAVGLLNADRAGALLAEPPLRPREELAELQQRLLAIHWRLRDFGLNANRMNFREFCDGRAGWLGTVDLREVRLVGDDLALGDTAIADADEGFVRNVSSAAMERHLASNWLMWGGVYADTDTST